MAVMNLMETDFPRAAFWGSLLSCDEVVYQGYLTGKVQSFRTVRGAQAGAMWAAHVISREDEDVWAAARDVIDRAVKDASVLVRGNYVLELLAFDPGYELKTFNIDELSCVMVNTARNLAPGAQAMVRYSSVHALLLKLADAHWGKITLKTSVTFIEIKPGALVSLFSAVFKAAEPLAVPGTLLVNDLSLLPVFDPAVDEELSRRLGVFFTKQMKKDSAFERRIYVNDRRGLRRVENPLESSG